MSIGILLLAADYLERRERESEHGYACLPQSHHPKSSVAAAAVAAASKVHSKQRNGNKKRLKRFQPNNTICPNRSTHNQLEKNRRAHMRICMEQLKKVVPLDGESAKHTTQGLLIKARRLIKSLEQNFVQSRQEMDQLRQSQERLQTQLHTLTVGRYRSERSTSESSIASSTSLFSNSPTHEHEQIDVVGYGSSSQGSIDTADELSRGSSVDSGCGLSPTNRGVRGGISSITSIGCGLSPTNRLSSPTSRLALNCL